MKSLTWSNLGIATLVLVVVGFFWFSYNRAQADDCCPPPQLPAAAARFQPNAPVTVYIDSDSGFTSDEMTAIGAGLEDWNDEPNNSGVNYNVVQTTNPPTPGGNNTVIASFVNSSNSSEAAITMTDQRVNGVVTNVSGTLTFWNNIRSGTPSLLLGFLRSTARHEGGHGLGLANSDLVCPQGSNIMWPSSNVETFITPCDNAKINEDPVYGGTPTPTPTPTPAESGQFDCNDNVDNDGDFLTDCEEPACNNWCINGCNAYMWQVCWDLGTPQCVNGQCYTPILIDTLGNGMKLTSAREGVPFKVINGKSVQLSWTTPNSDDAWLVLDRNGNGSIDGGEEQFGNATPQPAPPPGEDKNGFLALAEYDKSASGGNGDGVINSNDAVFASLLLWQDTNHNGVSEATELHALSELGLATLELAYKESKRIDQYGNQFRYRAKVKDQHDNQIGRWAWDVFLKMGP